MFENHQKIRQLTNKNVKSVLIADQKKKGTGI